MSEQDRFLLTFDSVRGVPVKVEKIGEAGELTEVDLSGFLHLLKPGPAAGTPQPIVINVYGGGAQGAPVVEQPGGPSKPPVYYDQGPLHKPKKDE